MIFVAAIPLLIWTYLLFFRGDYWRVSKHLSRVTPRDSSGARVIAIVPARNEAAVIAGSVTSLLEQVPEIHVIVVDDGSTDGTYQLARSAAERIGGANRLTTIQGRPLPAGWAGKVWAMSQGVNAAFQFAPDYLLLTDADIAHASGNVQQLLAIAQSGGFDLVSLMVKLECRTAAERALIPAFVYFFFQLYPPAWIESSRHATAGAAGGCILIRPEALALSGGFESIRNAVIDDCALAQQVKSNGCRLWLGLTESAWSMRGYGSFKQVRDMIARTAFNQLRHSGLLLAATLGGILVVYVLPPVLALTLRGIPAVLGLAAWILMSISYLPTLLFYRRSPVSVLALPLVALFYGAATVQSAARYWRGQGGFWKGRVQDVRPD